MGTVWPASGRYRPLQRRLGGGLWWPDGRHGDQVRATRWRGTVPTWWRYLVATVRPGHLVTRA